MYASRLASAAPRWRRSRGATLTMSRRATSTWHSAGRRSARGGPRRTAGMMRRWPPPAAAVPTATTTHARGGTGSTASCRRTSRARRARSRSTAAQAQRCGCAARSRAKRWRSLEVRARAARRGESVLRGRECFACRSPDGRTALDPSRLPPVRRPNCAGPLPSPTHGAWNPTPLCRPG